jgi:hypothetical protein
MDSGLDASRRHGMTKACGYGFPTRRFENGQMRLREVRKSKHIGVIGVGRGTKTASPRLL